MPAFVFFLGGRDGELVVGDDAALARFHAGIYWDAFATQQEPLDVWRRALRGELPYELTVRVVLDGEVIAGGICYEHYPRSDVGLATYMVVAPEARCSGLGERLLREAVSDLQARGAPFVLGEANEPRSDEDRERLARFLRWGARILDVRYVQPALGEGLARDRGLVLLALPGDAAIPDELPGAVVRAFVDELYAVTEGGPPDSEVEIPERVRLR